MIHSKRPTTPPQSLQLARQLVAGGYRLFSIRDARKVAELTNLDIKDMKRALASLRSHGWSHSLKRDLYCLDSLFLRGQPVHEFEIATHLVTPSAISHFSAFHHHELTDQIPQIVFATTPTGTSLPRVSQKGLFTHKGVRYCYSQVKKEYFFGVEKVWVGEANIPMTDLERTLLDGLMKPKYCGGFMEVLSAYSTPCRYSIAKLIEYALQLDVSVAKRLGWILEYIGVENERLKTLASLPFSGFIKLDSSAEKVGPYNKRWKIQENI
jgi:predicted transcriptional regulator of viral defense system